MAYSKATSVKEYLEELSAERREVISAVRSVICRNLPPGYEEALNWGMISYEVPLSRYGKTYNGQPLQYAALASQKNHCALYLSCVYQDPEQLAWLKKEFQQAGKKLDMGKSCLRFRRAEDLPLDVIGRLIAATPVSCFIELYEASRRK